MSYEHFVQSVAAACRLDERVSEKPVYNDSDMT
jgi:hypothetical protein